MLNDIDQFRSCVMDSWRGLELWRMSVGCGKDKLDSDWLSWNVLMVVRAGTS